MSHGEFEVLCTSDVGALIAKDTPFKLFPFDINYSRSGGGRKHLWLARNEYNPIC